MNTSFFDYLDRQREEAAKTPEGQAFAAAGFVIDSNGGGTTAWSREVANLGVILITDSEGCNHKLSTDGHITDADKPDRWLVGWHANDGSYGDCEEADTPEQAIEVADRMQRGVVERSAKAAPESEPALERALRCNDLDAVVSIMQAALGIKTGDVAAQHFAGREAEYAALKNSYERALFLKPWMVDELASAAEQVGRHG